MTNVAPSFNLIPAEACTCCNRKIKQGYDVPFIGVVGPKCVRKFALLSYALTTLEGLQFAPYLTGETGQATQRLFSGLRALGFDPKKQVAEDGTCTLVVGRLATWRSHAKLCQTWEERRAEFERDLKLASARLAGQVAA